MNAKDRKIVLTQLERLSTYIEQLEMDNHKLHKLLSATSVCVLPTRGNSSALHHNQEKI